MPEQPAMVEAVDREVVSASLIISHVACTNFNLFIMYMIM